MKQSEIMNLFSPTGSIIEQCGNLNELSKEELARKGYHNHSNLYEAYFGGNPLLEEAEDCFARIKKVLDEFPMVHRMKRKDLARCDSEVTRIEEIFAEVFGIKNMLVNLGLVNYCNAFTYSCTYSWSSLVKPKKFTVYNGKYGIQFNPKYNVNVSMTVTLPLIKVCSPKEVIAIMIHEMGHNINKNRSISDQALNLPSTLIWGWLNDLLNSDSNINAIKHERDKEVAYQLNKDKEESSQPKVLQNPAVKKMISKLEEFKGMNAKSASNSIIFSAMFAILNKPIYKEENYSDSLAATYGYGEQIVTGLRKLYPGYEYLEEFGPFSSFLIGVAMAGGDPHPERIARARYVRDYLKNELDTNTKLTKEQREKLETDHKALDAIIDLDFTDKGQDQIGYRRSMEKHFGVTDLREKFFKLDHGKVDKKTRSLEILQESATILPLENGMENLNEVYYGSNPHLEIIQASFKNLIDYYNKRGFEVETLMDKFDSKDRAYTVQQLKNIENELCLLFGMKQAFIMPLKGGLGLVATYSVQSSLAIYGKKLKVYQGEFAVKFNPKAGVNVFLLLGLENILLMNERELTAVFIHEMGHNLNRNQTLPSKFWMKVPTIIKLLVSLIISDANIEALRDDREESDSTEKQNDKNKKKK